MNEPVQRFSHLNDPTLHNDLNKRIAQINDKFDNHENLITSLLKRIAELEKKLAK